MSLYISPRRFSHSSSKNRNKNLKKRNNYNKPIVRRSPTNNRLVAVKAAGDKNKRKKFTPRRFDKKSNNKNKYKNNFTNTGKPFPFHPYPRPQRISTPPKEYVFFDNLPPERQLLFNLAFLEASRPVPRAIFRHVEAC
jgi:hypothetical protein